MHTRDGFRQAFNGQAVVTSDQVIVAAEVVRRTPIWMRFIPMLDAARGWTRPGWPIRSGRWWLMPAIPTSRTGPGLPQGNSPILLVAVPRLGKKPAEGRVRKIYPSRGRTPHEQG